jgi:hypothetical protein
LLAKQQASFGAIFAFPVIDPPIGDDLVSAPGELRPDFLFPVRALQGDDGVVLAPSHTSVHRWTIGLKKYFLPSPVG